MTRRPCFCAPYHYRLDWNIWFLGFKPHQSMLQRRERWLFAFLLKLLAGDPPALSLLAAGAADGAAFRDPEPPHARKAPRYAKVDMYRYSMAEPLYIHRRHCDKACTCEAQLPPFGEQRCLEARKIP